MAEEYEKRKAYPSDLTDAQWAILEPLIPAPRNPGGGPEGSICVRSSIRSCI